MLVGGDRPAISKPTRPKPSFRISEEDLPSIKNWTVGKKYPVKVLVEMRSHSKGDSFGYDEGEDKKHEASLIVHSIKEDKSDGSE